MQNILLNYDREEIFDKVITTDYFDYYKSKLHLDDFCALQNDIAAFIGKLETKIVKG
jgi:hypothetical protein